MEAGAMKMMTEAAPFMEMTEVGAIQIQMAVGHIMGAMESPSILIPTAMKMRGTLDLIQGDRCLVH